MSDLPADTLTTTIANVIRQHRIARGNRDLRTHCTCGWDSTRARITDRDPTHADQFAAHVAAAVVSVLATHNEHTAADALRDAADDAVTAPHHSERWYEQRVWSTWLRDRADRLAAVSPTPPTHKDQA